MKLNVHETTAAVSHHQSRKRKQVAVLVAGPPSSGL